MVHPHFRQSTVEQKNRAYEALTTEMLVRQQSKEQSFKHFFLQTEMFKRNLTKRQRSIVSFISVLSTFYSKEKAIIPKLMDFELAGISKTHCGAELEKLEKMKVITWDRESNEFGILDPSGWEAPINAGYNKDRARELFFLNLNHAGIEVERIIKESLD